MLIANIAIPVSPATAMAIAMHTDRDERISPLVRSAWELTLQISVHATEVDPSRIPGDGSMLKSGKNNKTTTTTKATGKARQSDDRQ